LTAGDGPSAQTGRLKAKTGKAPEKPIPYLTTQVNTFTSLPASPTKELQPDFEMDILVVGGGDQSERSVA
jgi:hypothetical protein